MCIVFPIKSVGLIKQIKEVFMFKLDYIYFRRLFNKLWKKEISYNQFSDKYYFSAYIKSYVCDDNTHLDYYKDDVLGHFRT